ncbi:MAG: hypothetical protein KBT03_09595 [Bacteroidales bacterium]|nr:hypothetical protein [Candidatus Scybalousia scybalohippi]
MSCCDELKTLTIFKGFNTRFAGRPLVKMDFQSEGLDLTGFKAYLTLYGITKEFDDITSPIDVDFTAEETATFPVGLNYAEIIVEDLQGNKHPFSTAIPCEVKEWQEGDIELDNFDITITTDIQENTIVIKFENGGSGTFNHDELLHRDYDDQHPISAITGLRGELDDISQEISTETDVRQQADEALAEAIGNEAQARANADIALGDRINAEEQARGLADTSLGIRIDNEATTRGNADIALGNRIDSEEQARIDEDEALDQRIDEVVGDLGDHVQDKNNPHEVTKTQVGLGNVENLAPEDMPVSTAQENAIQAVQDNLDDETDARLLAEQGLQDQIDNLPTSTDVSSAISAHNTSSTAHSDIRTELGEKQPTLVSGTNIKTINSTTLLGSGNVSVATATQGALADTLNTYMADDISASNQIASRQFVNSSISTNTANFIGTFNSVAEMEAYSGTKTNNDYAFVIGTDTAGNTEYNRYKWTTTETPNKWKYEYTLNNSSFTADQWAAIGSKITETKVNTYDAHVENNTIHVTASDKTNWNGKSKVTIRRW